MIDSSPICFPFSQKITTSPMTDESLTDPTDTESWVGGVFDTRNTSPDVRIADTVRPDLTQRV